jgi:DNA-directed RNA polymerase subunit RPC12/RpoP
VPGPLAWHPPRGWLAVSGRIALHLDKGLGWTKPVFVASCRDCGTELARHPNQATAARAAGRRRCPGCGSRAGRRLPGSTSPATDLALASGRQASSGRWRRPLRTVPPRGSVVGREPGTAVDGRAPHRQPHPWKEVKAMSRPSLEELLGQVEEDGGGEATDGCWVEPDGSC